MSPGQCPWDGMGSGTGIATALKARDGDGGGEVTLSTIEDKFKKKAEEFVRLHGAGQRENAGTMGGGISPGEAAAMWRGQRLRGSPRENRRRGLFLGPCNSHSDHPRRPGSREKEGNATPFPARPGAPSARAGAEVTLTARGQRQASLSWPCSQRPNRCDSCK